MEGFDINVLPSGNPMTINAKSSVDISVSGTPISTEAASGTQQVLVAINECQSVPEVNCAYMFIS